MPDFEFCFSGSWRGMSEEEDLTKHGGWPDVEVPNRRCRLGKPGDQLWVRETTVVHGSIREQLNGYVASGCKRTEPWEKTIPAIHMRRAHSRITLEITEVRVQRLQDITCEDAFEEGVYGSPVWDGAEHLRFRDVMNDQWSVRPEMSDAEHTAAVNRTWSDYGRSGFAALWESIHGPGSWDVNPWVWAITFKVVKKS